MTSQGGKSIELKWSHFLALMGVLIPLLIASVTGVWVIYKSGISNGNENTKISSLQQQFSQFSKDNGTAHSEINNKIDTMNATLNQLVGKINKQVSENDYAPVVVSTLLNK